MNVKNFNPPRAAAHLLGVAVIVAVFLIVFGKLSAKTGVSSIDGGIALVDPSGSALEIIYADVTELALISLPETYGFCIEGASEKGYRYGLWENEEWGKYRLCVKEDMKKAIKVRQKDQILIFNYEGNKTTESFFEALRKKCGE